MSNNSGNGDTAASVSLQAESGDILTANQRLDALEQTFVKMVGSLNDFLDKMNKTTDATAKQADAAGRAEQATKRQTNAQNENNSAQEQSSKVTQTVVTEIDRMTAQVARMVETYGLSKIEIIELDAAQMGMTATLEALIGEYKTLDTARRQGLITQQREIDAYLESAAAAEREAAIQQKRDIEVWESRARYVAWWDSQLDKMEADEAASAERIKLIQQNRDIQIMEERAKYVTWWEGQLEKIEAAEAASAKRTQDIQEARDLWLYEERGKYVAWWEAQLAKIDAEEAASAERQKQIQQARDVWLYEERGKYIAWWESTLAAQEAAQAAAVEAEIAGREKAAMADIAYDQMSLKSKIAMLEKIKAMQANPDIRSSTVSNTFSNAAINDVGSLTAYNRALQDSLDNQKKLGSGATASAGLLENLGLKTAGVTRELMVLGHEVINGNWTRFSGSLITLGERMNITTLLWSALGAATIAAGAAAVFTGYEYIKGIEQQHEMQNALIMTGNYAGVTEGKLLAMADAAAGMTGKITVAREAVTQLAASGKFTGDQIQMIATAAVEMEHATGQSTDATIAMFEKLAVSGSTQVTRLRDNVTKELLKINDQWHMLTVTEYEEIRAMEKSGDMMGASKRAMELMSDTIKERTDESVKNMGNLQRAWETYAGVVSRVKGMIMDWGKTLTPEQNLADAKAKLAAFDKAQENVKSVKAPNGTGGGAVGDYIHASAQEISNMQTSNQLLGQRQKLLDAISTAEKAYNDAKKKAEDDSKKVQVEGAAVNALARQDQAAETYNKKNQTRAQQEIDSLHARVKAWTDWEQMTGKKIETKDKAASTDPAWVAEQEKLITARYTPKGKTANDGRLTDLHTGVNEIEASYKEVMTATNGFISFYQTAMGTELGSHKEFYEAISEIRQAQLKAAEDAYAKEEALTNSYQAKGLADAAKAKGMHQDALNRLNERVAAVKAAQQQMAGAMMVEDKQNFTKTMQDVWAQGSKEVQSLQNRIDKQKEYNATVGKTAEQIQILKGIKEASDEADREREAAALKDVIERIPMDAQSLAIYQARLAFLTQEIAKYKELQGEKLKGSVAAAADPQLQVNAANKFSQDWKNAATEIQRALKDAFGSVGATVGAFFKSYADGIANQAKLTAEYNKKLADVKNTTDEAGKTAAIQQEKGLALTQEQMNMYGNMAGAAQSYFQEGSTGYQAMGAASKVFHIAEVAMMAIRMVQQGTLAVLNQGQGDPYTAFARMAAMAAIVTGLGVAIGNAGASSDNGAQMQKDTFAAQGTGTVAGDATAKSKSISEALNSIDKQTSIELDYSNKQINILKQINAGIAGLAVMLYGNGNGITTGANMGIMTGTLAKNTGDPIANMLGINQNIGLFGLIKNSPILGSLTTKLQGLWGKTTQDVTDSGINLNGTAGQMASGSGANQYAQVQTTNSSWFGLVKDTTVNQLTQPLNQALSEQFGKIFKNVDTSISAAAGELGAKSQDFDQKLQDFVINTGNVSLKDLKGQDLTDALNNIVSQQSDEIAQTLVPGLTAFQQAGEGYYQTLVRVAGGVDQAQAALNKLRVNAINYADIANKQGDVATEMVRQSLENAEAQSIVVDATGKWSVQLNGVGQIIQNMSGSVDDLTSAYKDLIAVRAQINSTGQNGSGLTQTMVNGAGDVATLKQGVDDYMSKFFTDGQQVAATAQQLSAQFSKLGFDMPKTKDQFKTLINSLDLTTEYGQKTYGELMSLAGAFGDLQDKLAGTNAQVYEQADNVKTLAAAAQAFFNTIQSAQDLLDKIDTATGATIDYQSRINTLWAGLQAAAKGNTVSLDQQLSMASDLNDLISKKYQVENTALQTQLSLAKSLGDYLKQLATSDLSPATAAQKLMVAQQQYQATLAGAKSGDATAQSNLQSDADNYLKLAQGFYASNDQYTGIFQQVTSDITGFTKTLPSVADSAAQQVQISAQQAADLEQLRDIVVSIQDQAQTSYNNATTQLQVAINTLQVLSNTYGVVSGLPDILAGLPNAMVAAISSSGILNSLVTNANQITSSYTNTNTGTSTPASFYTVSFNNGYTVAGSHAGGLSDVPYNGYVAELHKGERVLTSSENYNYTKGANKSANADLVAEIKALRDEVTTLRREQSQQTGDMIRSHYDSTDRAADKMSTATKDAASKAAYKQKLAASMN